MGQLQELKKTMVSDVQRMQEEVKRHFAQQKAENQRLQQQITTLKGEKTSLQQQILGLQRRIKRSKSTSVLIDCSLDVFVPAGRSPDWTFSLLVSFPLVVSSTLDSTLACPRLALAEGRAA